MRCTGVPNLFEGVGVRWGGGLKRNGWVASHHIAPRLLFFDDVWYLVLHLSFNPVNFKPIG